MSTAKRKALREIGDEAITEEDKEKEIGMMGEGEIDRLIISGVAGVEWHKEDTSENFN